MVTLSEQIDMNDQTEYRDQTKSNFGGAATVVYPLFVSIIAISCILMPVFGLAYGDALNLGAITVTEIYLAATIGLSILLVFTKFLFSYRYDRFTLTLVWACLPLLAASLLSVGVSVLEREDLSARRVVWGLFCVFAIVYWLIVTSELSFSIDCLPLVLPFISIPTLVIYFVSWWYQGYSFPCAGLSVHKNAMGLATLCIFTLSLDASLKSINGHLIQSANALVVVMSVPVLITSGSRSALIGAVLVCALSVAFTLLRSQLIMSIVVITVFFMSIAFPIIYIESQSTLFGDELSEISNSYTGQTIYNGRQRIWDEALNEIWQRPLFGHGYSFLVERLDQIPMNSHNLFLGVMFQWGIVGICAFMLLLKTVWSRLTGVAFANGSFVYVAFFVTTLILQMLESQISGENHTAMFAIWTVLSIGMAYSSRSKK